MRLLIINAVQTDKRPSNILIEGERIVETGSVKAQTENVIDAKGMLILPGMIDVHAHLRDMDLAYKEDWLTGSKSAAAGGVTTIFDMPNTKPATFDQKSLQLKRKAAEKSIVNYGFNFGIKKDNLDEVRRADNIPAMKMFMAESSSGRVVSGDDLIREVFELSAEIGKPVIVHSELQSCVEEHSRRFSPAIENHNKIRNRECAIKSTEILIKHAREIGNSLYLAHISTAEEIQMIREAKQAGSERIYCEVTPHHLLINETVLLKAGNFGKVNPPLRTGRDNEAILEGIQDGTVDTIGSDHAPHGLEEKMQDYREAPSGFPGFETSLALLFNEYNKKNLTIERIIELTSTNPSRIFNIKDRGALHPGMYADLILVDPGMEWRVDPSNFFTKAKYSPYNGFKLFGKVNLTMVNGKLAFHDDKIYSSQGKEVEFR